MRNLLLNEKNELHNRELHISGFWEASEVNIGDGKVDIEQRKVDIEGKKVDIESAFSEKARDFSIKPLVHSQKLFDRFGYDEIFGRGAVVQLLGLKDSSASKLIKKLAQAEMIEPVYGHGKGKYKFRKKD